MERKEGFMKETAAGLQLIRSIFHLDLLTEKADCALFSKRHQLHPVQMLLSREGIIALFSSARTDTIYFFQDPFYMELALFTLDGQKILIGPFSAFLMSEKDARDVLREHRITDLTPHGLLLYRESHPGLSEGRVLDIIRNLIHIYDADSGPRVVSTPRTTNLLEENDFKEMDRPHYATMLEQRYSFEQDFMEAIREGNAGNAIENLHKMQQDVSYLKRIGTALENERIGAAITRTTARIAALEAGLPSLLADRISTENTRITMSARSVSEILSAKEKMIRDFCTGTAEIRKGGHSAIGLSAVYYLRGAYHHPIRLDDLAESLCVSKSRLISIFKKEYGTTPMEYLTRIRMEQAGLLLTATDKTVQEISQNVGINDANYFVKVFRRTYQVTPTQWRKSHGQMNQ